MSEEILRSMGIIGNNSGGGNHQQIDKKKSVININNSK